MGSASAPSDPTCVGCVCVGGCWKSQRQRPSSWPLDGGDDTSTHCHAAKASRLCPACSWGEWGPETWLISQRSGLRHLPNTPVPSLRPSECLQFVNRAPLLSSKEGPVSQSQRPSVTLACGNQGTRCVKLCAWRSARGGWTSRYPPYGRGRRGDGGVACSGSHRKKEKP